MFSGVSSRAPDQIEEGSTGPSKFHNEPDSSSSEDDEDDTLFDETDSDSADRSEVGRAFEVGVVQVAAEWAGADSDSDSDSSSSSSGASVSRTARYRNMAKAIEAAEHEVEAERGHWKAPIKVRKVHGISAFLSFLATNLRIFTLIRCFFLHAKTKKRFGIDDPSLAVLLCIDGLQVIFNILSAWRDREYAVRRWNFKRRKEWCKLTFWTLHVVVVLGVFSGWKAVRAWRLWRDPKYRDSFIIELTDTGMVSDAASKMPRCSSHFAFLFEMPFVMRMTFPYVKRMEQLVEHGFAYFGIYILPDSIMFSAWTLCMQILVLSVMAFDHSISNFLQEKYKKSGWGFPMLHYSYRLSEIMSCFLVVGAIIIGSDARPHRALGAVVVNYTLILAALAFASRRIAWKSFCVAIMMQVSNLSLFVDHPKLRGEAFGMTIVWEFAWAVWVSIGCSIYWQMMMSIEDKQYGYKAAYLVLIVTMTARVTIGYCTPLARSHWHFLYYDLCGRSERKQEFVNRPIARKASQNIYGLPLEARYGEREDLVSQIYTRGIGDQYASLIELVREKEELRLSRLQECAKLGQGSFGSVLKVHDTRAGQFYALKLQRKGPKSRYAVREAEALHQHNHCFIVKVERIFRTYEFYGILLELLDCDLNAKVVSRVPSEQAVIPGLPMPQLLHYAACMLCALTFLHSRNVVFRDLKPENVLVTDPEIDHSPYGHAKLADFGLARSVGADTRRKPRQELPDRCPPSAHLTSRPVSAVATRALEGPPSREGSPPTPSLPSRATSTQQRRITTAAGTPAFMPLEAFDVATEAPNSRSLFQMVSSWDWYAFGWTLFILLQGEQGNRRIHTSGRVVLLPPADDLKAIAVARAKSNYRAAGPGAALQSQVLDLVAGLVVESSADRLTANQLRAAPVLAEALETADAMIAASNEKKLQSSRDGCLQTLFCCRLGRSNQDLE